MSHIKYLRCINENNKEFSSQIIRMKMVVYMIGILY